MSAKSQYVAFGDRRYVVQRPWLKFPADLPLGMFSKGAVDVDDNLLVCQRRDPPILVFDTRGEFVRSFGDGVVDDAHGICVAPDGRIFVVDRDGQQVLGFDREGRLLLELGQHDSPQSQMPFSHPTDADVGPNGDISVADGYGNTVVHRFSSAGHLIGTWGGLGRAPGLFITPHGLKVLGDGRVLVGDRENNRIQVFDADGRYLTEWTDLFHPMDIHVGLHGIIYVSDQIPSVQARRDDGSFVGRCKPAIASPHGFTGDRQGNLFVIETRSNQVTRLSPV